MMPASEDNRAANTTERPSRRRFLKVLATAVSLPMLTHCGPAGVGPAPIGDLAAGNISGLPEGTLRSVGGAPACIGRDAGGVYAMTLTCTHQGCNIAASGTVSAQGIWCACHGARFDANGDVQSGPAPAPLQHFEVSADGDGNLTMHGDSYVGAEVRLAV